LLYDAKYIYINIYISGEIVISAKVGQNCRIR